MENIQDLGGKKPSSIHRILTEILFVLVYRSIPSQFRLLVMAYTVERINFEKLNQTFSLNCVVHA